MIEKISLSIIAMLLLLFQPLLAQPAVANLLTENLKEPIGLGEVQPRFSWQIESAGRNITQTAYDIKVTDNDGTVWERRCLYKS